MERDRMRRTRAEGREGKSDKEVKVIIARETQQRMERKRRACNSSSSGGGGSSSSSSGQGRGTTGMMKKSMPQNKTKKKRKRRPPPPQEPQCCICFDPLSSAPHIGILSCDHRFCLGCITEWMETAGSIRRKVVPCPLCRERATLKEVLRSTPRLPG